jgi:hypothetical protein
MKFMRSIRPRFILAIIIGVRVSLLCANVSHVVPPTTCNCSVQMSPSEANMRGTDKDPLVFRTLEAPRAGGVSEDNSGWWVAGFTGALSVVTAALAIFTYKLWKSTGDLVREGSDTAKRELRAYVFPMAIERERALQVHLGPVSVKIQNFGRTPAYQMAVSVRAEIARAPEDLTLIATAGPALGHLAPGAQYATSVTPVVAIPSHIGPSTSEFDDHGSELFVHGLIEYRDTFGRQRVTRFRLKGISDGNFVSCGRGNDTDDDFAMES